MPVRVPPASEMTLPVLRERFRQYALTIRNVGVCTFENQLIYLKRLFEFLGSPRTAAELFGKLQAAALTALLKDYAARYGAGSRRNMHTALRAFLHFAYEEQFMGFDLSGLVPTIRNRAMAGIPECLPEACIVALEESIDRSTAGGRRDAAIVCLLSTYGVRGVQIRQLCLEHIDWENSRIHFPAAKGGRLIVQYLTAKAGNRLADYIVGGRPQSPHREVFLRLPTGTPLTSSAQLSGIIGRRLHQGHVSVPENVSRGTHGFRHAFARRMTGRVPFKDVVDMLGHRSPSSTLFYAKVDVQSLQQAALPWPGGVA